ncbi:MAG: PIN domain-containing protein [bacterium]|nr:PIN domain-containing protein [bacterium]
MNMVVADLNVIYQCLGFLKNLLKEDVQVVIPRAAYEELEGVANNALDWIKKGRKENKWRMGLKIFPEVKELVGDGTFKVAGSYKTGWLYKLGRLFQIPSHVLLSIGFARTRNDLRVLATCIVLKENHPDDVVQLLTYDRCLRERVKWLKRFEPKQERFNIILPRLHWYKRRREFDLNEVLDPVIKKFQKEASDVRL